MKKKPTKKTLEQKIRESKARIAKERDKLRALLADANEVLDSTEDALESLEYAIEQLSTTV